MKSLLSKCASLFLAAGLATIAGVSFAGPVQTTDRVIFAQSDQDPNTPPDCKKYPKDVRCKK
jgi:hypothetical protein